MKKILLILTSLSASLALQAGALSPCQTNSKNSNQGLGANIQTIIQSCGCSGSTCDLSNINTAQMQTILNSPSCTSINLTGANLTNAYLEGLTNATKLILTGANLSGACLSGIDFSTVQFNGGALTGADLSGAILHSANLDSVTLGGTYTTNQNGQTLTFKTNLNNTSLTNATLTNIASAEITASYSASTPKTTPLTIASTLNWQTANFSGANLNGADLRNLASSNLTLLEGTNLTNADLSGTVFTNIAIPAQASFNFGSANLQNTQFNGGSLNGVVMSGTNFTNASFSNIDMSNANLSNANFTNAVFNNVTFMTETNGVLPAPNLQLSSNIEGVNFSGATFNVAPGLMSLLASYNGNNPSTFNGAKLVSVNFNAGPNVTLDLTHCNFDGAIFGNWVASGAITSTIGGESVNGSLYPIEFPFMTNVTFNNVQFENLNTGLSSTNSTFNNCQFVNGLVGLALFGNSTYKGAQNSPFAINHGSNNLYANCSFIGIAFNNSPNPKNSSVVGMQNAQFVGSLEIAGCYFQNTDFTGIEFSNPSGSEKANFSAFSISNSTFTSLLNSSTSFGPSSFFHQISTNQAANSNVLTDWTHITFKCVDFKNINPANQTQVYGIHNPYLGHCMA